MANRQVKTIILNSNLFDEVFYLRTYRDARIADETPINHYCKIGIEEDRKPNKDFDPTWYREYYADVKKDGILPFMHYIDFGRHENRRINSLENEEYLKLKKDSKFDIDFYKNSYEDLKNQNNDFDFILHYIRHGKSENRNLKFKKIKNNLKEDSSAHIENCTGNINISKYLEANKDIADAINTGNFKSGSEHFLRYGKNEIENGKRKLYVELPYFNVNDYLRERIDVREAIDTGEYTGSIFEHYLAFGANELLKDLLANQAHIKNPYESWLNVNAFNDTKKTFLSKQNRELAYKPLISIIIPVFNPPLKFLKQAIESVQSQIYTNWEICIADDASCDTRVRPFLENLISNNKNIRVIFREKNGHISQATNSAAKLAQGEYVLFLDQDDILSQDALIEILIALNNNNDVDLLYTDDDKIDTEGNRFAPQFKPDWSPELLLSYMYMGHILCAKKSLFFAVGGFHKGLEGSQDYDCALRMSEKAKNIIHIPKILYHWRVLPGSTAAGGNEKDYSFDAGIRAVQGFLDRGKINGKAFQPDWALKNGNGIYSIDFPDEGQSVAIIIPTKNQKKLLKQCLDSLDKTTYKNYKIYIIDNDSDEQDTRIYLKNIDHTVLKISSPNGKFNFSYINNQAAKRVNEELILFLNNDTEVIEPKWLSQMVGYIQFNNVGSVGAKLIFPNEKIQHAGILHGMSHGFPAPAFKLHDRNNGGYLNYANVSRNYMAVTAACMLTKRELFFDIGAFNETDYAVAYNDVDYGFRLIKKGLRNVYCPSAILYHHEGASRGHGDKPTEEANYIRQYSQLEDKYYNPNLAKKSTIFQMASKSIPSIKPCKIKVVMVTHNLNLEGAPKSFYELAKGLKMLGTVEPIVLSHADGPLRKEYESEGINVQILKSFNILNTQNKEQMLDEIGEYTKIIKSISPDVIYGNTVQTFWVIKAAKELDIASIWNIRESEIPFSSFDPMPHIKSLAISSIEYPYQVVFVADATQDIYEALNTNNNFMTIHNGFDEDANLKRLKGTTRKNSRNDLQIKEDEIYILIVGTVCDRKGQKDLINAIEKLDEDMFTKIKIGIVGDRPSIPYSKELHQLIAQLPAKNKNSITVFAETMDVCKHYQSADIFICASRIESFPKVIQEAMYFELAIITTPVFGIVEQVRDEVSSLYYKPGDTKKLSQQIKRLVQDEKLRKNIAANGKVALGILPTFKEVTKMYEGIFIEAWWSGRSR